MNFRNLLIFLVLSALFSFDLYAQKGNSVLKLCAFKDEVPFMLSTYDAEEAKKLGFKKYKDSELYVRNFNVLLDDANHPFYKPSKKERNCVVISKIRPGTKEASLDFKSSTYTALETLVPYSTKFKPNLLHEGKIEITEGPVATVKIVQSSDKIALYQSLDNEPVADCSQGCSVPTDIPIYFMIKSDDEKVLCPVKFQLVLESERDKNLPCYDFDAVQKVVENYVKDNDITCKNNIEYAFFKVYGEGCILSFEADKNGLAVEQPQIKLTPLEKQKVRYFLKVNSEEKKPYLFSGDRKGAERTPAENDVIEFIEEKQH